MYVYLATYLHIITSVDCVQMLKEKASILMQDTITTLTSDTPNAVSHTSAAYSTSSTDSLKHQGKKL